MEGGLEGEDWKGVGWKGKDWKGRGWKGKYLTVTGRVLFSERVSGSGEPCSVGHVSLEPAICVCYVDIYVSLSLCFYVRFIVYGCVRDTT